MKSTKYRTIMESMKKDNKHVFDFIPKVVEEYVKKKYKCSSYLAKQVAKDLTQKDEQTI